MDIVDLVKSITQDSEIAEIVEIPIYFEDGIHVDTAKNIKCLKCVYNTYIYYVCPFSVDDLCSGGTGLEAYIYTYLKENDAEYRTNCAVIISCMIPEVNEKYTSTAFELEGDPYFFKTHVMYYTQKQIDQLSDIVNRETILDAINNEALYSAYVNSIDDHSSIYGFYHSLATKLPFIPYIQPAGAKK